MSKDKTRREFIKETCVNTLMGGMFLSQIPLPLDPLPDDIITSSKPENIKNLQTLVVDIKSRTEIVKGMTPDISLVKQMVDSGITLLTGKDNPKDAWKSFFHEDERIGIKINGLGADILAGNYQICWAIVDALKEIGVKEIEIFYNGAREWSYRISLDDFGTDAIPDKLGEFEAQLFCPVSKFEEKKR